VIAYDGNPPGIAGVHFGGDGIGVDGAMIPTDGTNGASIIAAALEADPVAGVEYRLHSASIPAGFTCNENGGGAYTGAAKQIAATFTLFANGVELP
jgi:hypothetical protein